MTYTDWLVLVIVLTVAGAVREWAKGTLCKRTAGDDDPYALEIISYDADAEE